VGKINIRSRINSIVTLLDKLEQDYCDYSFHIITVDGIVVSRSFSSKPSPIDLFQINDIVKKVLTIVNSIPMDQIDKLLIQFPHDKITKVIGYRNDKNKSPKTFAQGPHMMIHPPTNRTPVPSIPDNLKNTLFGSSENFIDSLNGDNINPNDSESLHLDAEQTAMLDSFISDFYDLVKPNNRDKNPEILGDMIGKLMNDIESLNISKEMCFKYLRGNGIIIGNPFPPENLM